MGPGHESILTLQPWDTQAIPFFHFDVELKAVKAKKTKKKHREITNYRKKNPDCPIYTSVTSLLQNYCSANKVKACMDCRLLFYSRHPAFVYIPRFFGLDLEAGQDGGSWSGAVSELWGCFLWCAISKATTAGSFRSVLFSRSPDGLHGICSENSWRRPARLHLCLFGQI